MNIQRISAFSRENQGGNPAGVVINDAMPAEHEMQKIAKDVGYSETAFLAPSNDHWRIRYFAPEIEVPFCGHATIASGAALGAHSGTGRYTLQLNTGTIEIVVTQSDSGQYQTTLMSPPTSTSAAPQAITDTVFEAFNLTSNDIDDRFPVRYANAGAKHLILVLKERSRLASMAYAFDPVQRLMLSEDIVTINLLNMESDVLFHARNAFAYGGVVEDPATGAAAAAFAGYLRDLNWPGPNTFEIHQGEDMGSPSRLMVSYSPTPGEGVSVTGETYVIDAAH